LGELTALSEAPSWIYGAMVRTIIEEGGRDRRGGQWRKR